MLAELRYGESFSVLFRDLLLCWSIKHDWYLATKYLFCAGHQHFAPIGALYFGELKIAKSIHPFLHILILMEHFYFNSGLVCSFWAQNWKWNPSQHKQEKAPYRSLKLESACDGERLSANQLNE